MRMAATRMPAAMTSWKRQLSRMRRKTKASTTAGVSTWLRSVGCPVCAESDTGGACSLRTACLTVIGAVHTQAGALAERDAPVKLA